jgi:hypothetical protein
MTATLMVRILRASVRNIYDMADLIPNFFQNRNPFSENQIFKPVKFVKWQKSP